MFLGKTLLAQCLSSHWGVYTIESLHNGHFGDRGRWPLYKGGRKWRPVQLYICDCGGVNCLFNLVHVCTSLPDVIFTMHFNIGRNRTDSQATWSSHLCRTLTLNTARYGFRGHFFIIVVLSCLITSKWYRCVICWCNLIWGFYQPRVASYLLCLCVTLQCF